MKFTFDFDFCDFNVPNEVWSFEISSDNMDAIKKMIDEFTPEYEDFWADMEEYGVHDCWGDDETMVGFSSYEIDPKNKSTVLEKWKEFFENHDCKCGELVLEESRAASMG